MLGYLRKQCPKKVNRLAILIYAMVLNSDNLNLEGEGGERERERVIKLVMDIGLPLTLVLPPSLFLCFLFFFFLCPSLVEFDAFLLLNGDT